MKFIVLAENRKKCLCDNEEGLSLYIEIDDNKLLLDTGITDLFIKNSKILDVDLNQIETIVLSHGHWDHGNGLKYLENTENKTIILHPECFTDRYSIRRQGEYAGINLKLEEMSEKYNTIQSREPYQIFDDVWYLGQIERANDFEAREFPTELKNGEIDYLKDDSGIAIKTNNGIVVISGCSHSGICNTVEHAKKVTKENKVYAVIGGFHLKNINKITEDTIKYFINNNISKAYMGHCTSDEVIVEFEKKLKGKCEVEMLYAGLDFKI